MTKSSFSLTAAALGISLLTCSPQLSAGAKDGAPKSASAVTLRAIAGTGAVSGKVDAPKEFKAAEVYIRNADKNIVYLVYTAAGRYQATDLLPGSYELTVRKNGFAADTKKLVIAAGDNATIDFSLREAPLKPVLGVHPGYNGREKQSASYEQLYPAGPGRLLIEKTCMVCHGPDFIPSHHWSASQWNEAIDLMSDPNGLIKSRILPGTFSAKDREEMVDYLVKYYGPDSEPRHLEVPGMPLDEKALASAMYVEYDVPKQYGSPIHDEHFDQEGNVWVVNRAAGRPSIDKLDPRTGAWKSYPIPDPKALPHGMTLDGSDDLWFAGETAFGRVNAKTGEMKLYYFDDKDSYIPPRNRRGERHKTRKPWSHPSGGLQAKHLDDPQLHRSARQVGPQNPGNIQVQRAHSPLLPLRRLRRQEGQHLGGGVVSLQSS